MAIKKARDILNSQNPTADEIQKSIQALGRDSEYVRKCVAAGFRNRVSGAAVMQEISDLV